MSAANRLVVIAAGGTGGHVFPAEALAAELLERGCRLAVVTDRRGGQSMSGALAKSDIHFIRAGGIAGKSLSAILKSAPELAVGFVQAWALLKRLAPDAVVGFGGYAAMPTMMAATYAGLPTAIHEQNAVLGRANRLLAARVRRIATSFSGIRRLPAELAGKIVHTGMPVRPEVIALRESRYPPLEAGGPINLLITGGSQGARILSTVVPQAITLLPEALRSRLRLVQQCRPEDIENVRAVYAGLGMTPILASFFADLPARLAEAHLMIGRAGASTLAEVTVIGRPAILIPYPSAIDDHQTANAQALDAVGGGWLMPEPSFTPEALAERLQSLCGLPALLEKAASASWEAGRPDAAARLADMVLGLIPNGHRSEGRAAA